MHEAWKIARQATADELAANRRVSRLLRTRALTRTRSRTLTRTLTLTLTTDH